MWLCEQANRQFRAAKALGSVSTAAQPKPWPWKGLRCDFATPFNEEEGLKFFRGGRLPNLRMRAGQMLVRVQVHATPLTHLQSSKTLCSTRQNRRRCHRFLPSFPGTINPQLSSIPAQCTAAYMLHSRSRSLHL